MTQIVYILEKDSLCDLGVVSYVVCVCVCVCVCVRACVRACMHACVCTYVMTVFISSLVVDCVNVRAYVLYVGKSVVALLPCTIDFQCVMK